MSEVSRAQGIALSAQAARRYLPLRGSHGRGRAFAKGTARSPGLRHQQPSPVTTALRGTRASPATIGPRCLPFVAGDALTPRGAQADGVRGSGMPEAEQLREACQALEGLFLAHRLSELDRPVFGGGLLGSSVTRQVFRAQRNSALGAELGRRGALGLAKLLGAELGREGIVRGGDSG